MIRSRYHSSISYYQRDTLHIQVSLVNKPSGCKCNPIQILSTFSVWPTFTEIFLKICMICIPIILDTGSSVRCGVALPLLGRIIGHHRIIFFFTVDLLDLRPLPVTALGDMQLAALYKFSHFNPVQTQIFHTLYHTDSNVLLGT